LAIPKDIIASKNRYFLPDDSYLVTRFELQDDYEGKVEAVLLNRNTTKQKPKGAILYLHGFLDYFFQHHFATFLNDKGYNFYALDLRKYGRSILPHQRENFCKDLAEYFEEIDLSIKKIKHDGNSNISIIGHSTGGLIAAYYLHKKPKSKVKRLVLNSPFLDFYLPNLLKKGAIPLVSKLGETQPFREIPVDLTAVYTHSIHKEHHGIWDFNLKWKPPTGFKLYAGWFNAIYSVQQKLKTEGFTIKCPVLLAHAKKSSFHLLINEECFTSDIVLNANDYYTLGPKLGNFIKFLSIKDGIHDLALSRTKPREEYFQGIVKFLQEN
jgi:alpha-beta hydrolase superfamily lysophospholipase